MSIVLSQWERHLSVPNQGEANRNIIVLPLNQTVNINQQTTIGKEIKDILMKQIGTEFPSEVNLDFKASPVTFYSATGSHFSPGWICTHYVAKYDFYPLFLLPTLPKC